MLVSIPWQLPFTHPVVIFFFVLLISLVVPLSLQKIRTPGIIGLILAGVLIGPHGLHLIDKGVEFNLMSTIGLLYLMFLVGLEIDLIDLRKNKIQSIAFGFFSFVVPLTMGFLVSFFVFKYSVVASLIIASMISTQTLISYPIISRMGLTKIRAATVTFGGTIITDAAVLILVSGVAGLSHGTHGTFFIVRLFISLILLVFAINWGVPKISKWFFKNIHNESGEQYLFVFTVAMFSAILSEIAGIEPIFGVFLAGFALNRYIPHSSVLMNRIKFIGNTVFIPFFIIGVGMMVDIKVFFTDINGLIFIFVLIFIAIIAKYIGALIFQKIYSYNVQERNLLFGLSVSHAAATIAIVLIGFNLQIIDKTVFNGSVALVLITCLTSSIVVQYAGKKLVVIKNQDMLTSVDLPDRILVPVANPDTIENLLDFAILIKDPQSKEPIYPLSVINDDKNADKQIFIQKKNFQKAIEYASATENTLHLTTRVDLNVANGIARAIKDLAITKTIIGWGGNISTMNIIFGTILSHLLDKTEKMILVLRVHQPYNMFERLIVAAPPLSAYESGFADWLKVVLRIATSLNINMVFYTTNDSVEGIKLHLLKCKVNVEYHIFTEDEEFADLAKITGEHDLLFLINARKQTASYDADFDVLKRKLSKNFETKNFVLVYPEQEHVIEEQNS